MNDATGRSIKSLPALANQWWLLDCCVYTIAKYRWHMFISCPVILYRHKNKPLMDTNYVRDVKLFSTGRGVLLSSGISTSWQDVWI